MSEPKSESDEGTHPKPNTRDKFPKRQGVDLQVFFLTATIVIVSCSAIFLIGYYLSYSSMIASLRDRANNIHNFMDSRLKTGAFLELQKSDDASLPLYQESKELLEMTRSITGVRYLYTACQNEDGDFIYLVDGLPADSPDFRNVGDPIEPECIPELKRALSGETVLPHKIIQTTWGSIFFSYFPMHAGDKIVGVLGIEFDAQRQYSTYQRMSYTAPFIIFLSCLVAAGIAVVCFRRISNPTYQDMANTDFLTGQKNRNAFEVDLHNLELSSAKKNASFISIDLDGLKMVNDTYGHEAGDEYIKKSCSIMAEVVGERGVLYRIGGDEFVVILQKQTAAELRKMIADMERLALSASLRSPFPFSLSTGPATYNQKKDASLSDALRRSDTRMYEQKKQKYAAREKQ